MYLLLSPSEKYSLTQALPQLASPSQQVRAQARLVLHRDPALRYLLVARKDAAQAVQPLFAVRLSVLEWE